LDTLPAATEEFVCPAEDGLYADTASDCQAYHQCVGKKQSIHLCPNPSVFNEALGVCDGWDKVDCGLYADAFHDSHRTRPKRQAADTCDTASQPAGTPIPDEHDHCRSYHLCVYTSGQLVRLQLKCPAGKVMHPEHKRCVRGDTCQDAINFMPSDKNSKTSNVYGRLTKAGKPNASESKKVLSTTSKVYKRSGHSSKPDPKKAVSKKASSDLTQKALSHVSDSRVKRTTAQMLDAASTLGASLQFVHVESVHRRAVRDLDELSVQKYAPDKPSRLDEYVDDEDESEVATPTPEQRVLDAPEEEAPPPATTLPPPSEFSCRGRRLEAFHVNPWDCQLFHMCAPSDTAGRLLNLRFSCGAGAVFEEAAQKCVPRTFCLR
jgi:Chitin binding Peritrophin-A domain